MTDFIGRVRVASSGWSGGPGLNTFYFRAVAEPGDYDDTAADLAVTRVHAAIDAAKTLWHTTYRATVSKDVDVLDAVDGTVVNTFSSDESLPVISGTNAAGYGPTAVGLLLRYHTGVVHDGSTIKGRAFLSPCSIASDLDGTPTSGLMALAQTYADELMDVGGPAGPNLVVWRRPRAAVTTGPHQHTQRDGLSAMVASITVPDKYVVLRSRRD